MNQRIAATALLVSLLAACSSAPQRKVEPSSPPVENRRDSTPTNPDAAATGSGGYLAGDGPGADAPANIDALPDAVPKIEPLHRYANRPYVALGKTYTPLTSVGHFKQRGIASWYGKKFHGRRTSIGEIYDMYAMSAAHPTLPVPSYARVTNLSNNKSVVVRINDRGPFLHDRAIDLSYAAGYKLNIIRSGSAEVEVESINPDSTIAAIKPADAVQSKPLEDEVPASPASTAVLASSEAINGNVYLQLGAFKSRQAAESFMAKMSTELGDVGKQLSIFVRDGLTRVHLGPYTDQNAARSSAASLQTKLGFKPLLNLH